MHEIIMRWTEAMVDVRRGGKGSLEPPKGLEFKIKFIKAEILIFWHKILYFEYELRAV